MFNCCNNKLMSVALIVEPLLHLSLRKTCLPRENTGAARYEAISFECAQQYVFRFFSVAEPLDSGRAPELLKYKFLSAKLGSSDVLHAFFVDQFWAHFPNRNSHIDRCKSNLIIIK